MRRTGGSIEYVERRTIAQYEHKECRFIMAFAFDDGEDDIPAKLTEIQAEVRSRVHQMLGLAALAAVKPAMPTASEAIAAAEQAPAPKAKRGPKPKPPLAAVDADPTDPVEEAAPTSEAAMAAEVDELDDLLTEPAVKAITDVDLNEAIKGRNAVLKAPIKIRELISKFAKSASMIPADKRQQFLDALAALK